MIKRCQHCETWNHEKRDLCRKCFSQLMGLCPSDATDCSVAVLLKPREVATLDGLCTQKDMTRQGVMMAALRLYQAVAVGAAEVTWKPTGPVGCMGDDCPLNVPAVAPATLDSASPDDVMAG